MTQGQNKLGEKGSEEKKCREPETLIHIRNPSFFFVSFLLGFEHRPLTPFTAQVGTGRGFHFHDFLLKLRTKKKLGFVFLASVYDNVTKLNSIIGLKS